MSAPPPLPPPAAEPPNFFALPTQRTWLTQALLGMNVLLFVALTLFADNGFFPALVGGADPRTLVLFGAKFNPLIVAGEWWRLLTPIFLHIGLVHLLFNQWALLIFGRDVEALFGPLRFGVIYFLAGLFGSVLSFALSPAISAGASGAIFGVIGAQALFFLRNRDTLGEAAQQRLRSLLSLIAINILLIGNLPGIDNWGHIGGLLSGALLGALLTPTYELRALLTPPFAQVVERPQPLPTWLVAIGGLALLAAAFLVALPRAPLPRF